jgi:hypothetical protein
MGNRYVRREFRSFGRQRLSRSRNVLEHVRLGHARLVLGCHLIHCRLARCGHFAISSGSDAVNCWLVLSAAAADLDPVLSGSGARGGLAADLLGRPVAVKGV